MCVCACVCVCICVCLRVHVCVCVCMCVHQCTCTKVYKFTCSMTFHVALLVYTIARMCELDWQDDLYYNVLVTPLRTHQISSKTKFVFKTQYGTEKTEDRRQRVKND